MAAVEVEGIKVSQINQHKNNFRIYKNGSESL